MGRDQRLRALVKGGGRGEERRGRTSVSSGRSARISESSTSGPSSPSPGSSSRSETGAEGGIDTLAALIGRIISAVFYRQGFARGGGTQDFPHFFWIVGEVSDLMREGGGELSSVSDISAVLLGG